MPPDGYNGYDLAVTNDKPGACAKCKGTGIYGWGASVNGRMEKSGTCFSCRGSGKQSRRQMSRNSTYNRHKVAAILSADMRNTRDPGYCDPGELAEDRWNETHGDRF